MKENKQKVEENSQKSKKNINKKNESEEILYKNSDKK